MPKKFYRSNTDKQLAGVCGGIAEYFNWDSTLVRLATLVLILVTGFLPGLIVYVVAAAIAPVK
ncbi:PspC domain-containing protein [Candidatus Saccharibacteria bacterium 32-49-10]|nr:MAG: PspC domain-containing protein [Candidatus Saccharibacteria bacterium 32-49-10]